MKALSVILFAFLCGCARKVTCYPTDYGINKGYIHTPINLCLYSDGAVKLEAVK